MPANAMTREELERRMFAALLEELNPRAYAIALERIAKAIEADR